MNQTTIRPFNEQEYTPEEAAAWLLELDNRTKSTQTGYNSIDELATSVKALLGNQVTGFITRKTLAEIQALTGDINTAYFVLDDTTTPANNGTWGFDGTVYYQAAKTVNSGTFDAANNTAPATQKSTADYSATLRGGTVSSSETKDVSGGEVNRVIRNYNPFDGDINSTLNSLITNIKVFKLNGDSSTVYIYNISKTATTITINFRYNETTYNYSSTDLTSKNVRIVSYSDKLMTMLLYLDVQSIAEGTYAISPNKFVKESSVVYVDTSLISTINPYFTQNIYGDSEYNFMQFVKKIEISKSIGYPISIHQVNPTAKSITIKYNDGVLKYITLSMPLTGWNNVYNSTLDVTFSFLLDWSLLTKTATYNYLLPLQLSYTCYTLEIEISNDYNSNVFDRSLTTVPSYLKEAIRDVQLLTNRSDEYHLGRVEKTATKIYLTVLNASNTIVSQANIDPFIFKSGYQLVKFSAYTTEGFESYMLIDFNKIPIQNITYTNGSTTFLESTKRRYLLTNKWAGANWMTLGDSVTQRGQYQTRVISKCGINNLVNLGVSGSGLQVFADNVTSVNIADIDLVSVFGCINNFPSSVIGTMADDKNTASIYGYTKKVIDKILTLKPTVRLFWIGTYNVDDLDYGTGINKPNVNGDYAIDFINAMKEVCEFYSIPFLNLYTTIGWNEYNIYTYTSDGVHASLLVGMPLIGDLISAFIETI